MTRLVIRTGPDTDQWCDFIMKVVPAVRFLDNGGNLEEITYMNTGDNFDGSVMYYKTSDWDLINGWVYEDGSITSQFFSKEPYDPLTRVHAAQSMCIYEVIYTYYEYTDHKGQVVQFGGTITYNLIDCYPMEGGGGDENSGGGGATMRPSVYYSLELIADGNGTVSPAGAKAYSQNTSVSITATPRDSWTVFGGWFENGKDRGWRHNSRVVKSQDDQVADRRKRERFYLCRRYASIRIHNTHRCYFYQGGIAYL